MRQTALKNKARKHHKLLEMNSDTYTLRRKVMSIIYEAKKLVPSLPRVEVRIVKKLTCKDRVSGYAYLGRNIVHILDTTCDGPQLRHVVYHELCHAILGIDHHRHCKLMRPSWNYDRLCTRSECESIFIDYYNQS